MKLSLVSFLAIFRSILMSPNHTERKSIERSKYEPVVLSPRMNKMLPVDNIPKENLENPGVTAEKVSFIRTKQSEKKRGVTKKYEVKTKSHTSRGGTKVPSQLNY